MDNLKNGKTMSGKLLLHALIDRLKKNPNKNAIIFIENNGNERILSRQEVHEHVCAIGMDLKLNGGGPGHRVIIALPHCATAIYSLWAILFVGGSPCFFPYPFPIPVKDTFYTQILDLVKKIDARTVITLPMYEKELASILAPARFLW